MVYARPTHGSNFADGSATDATVVIDALANGLEALESNVARQNSMVGNLLTANQASVETDTTGFTASNATLARASGGERGTYCLEVTCTAGSGGPTLHGSTNIGSMPVIPGQSYTWQARVKSASITRLVSARIYWWTSAGNIAASTASNTGTGVTLSTSWQTVDITAVAPADAAYCSLFISAASSANGEVYLVDALGFWAGAGGEWAAPGQPVPNLGTRTTHPNTDDVLVQRWDSTLSRWQTVHYDSGWRALSSWTSGNTGLLSDVSGIALAPTGADWGTQSGGFLPIAGIAGGIHVRRRNGWLIIKIFGLACPTKSSTAGSNIFPTGSIPADWRSGSGLENYSPAALNVSSRTVHTTLATGYTGGGQLWMTRPMSDPSFNISPSPAITVFRDADTIPTSLPGTLVSAAPA